MVERLEKPVAEKDDKTALKIGIAAGCLAVAFALMIYTYRPPHKFKSDQRYYSDDDGATWYVDSVNNIPPYQHNGKTAVAAQIYSYAGGSKQFCGYLVRFPDRLKAQIEKDATPTRSAGQLAWGGETRLQVEVKAPKSAGPWVAFSSPAGVPVIQVRTPDGSELDDVLP